MIFTQPAPDHQTVAQIPSSLDTTPPFPYRFIFSIVPIINSLCLASTRIEVPREQASSPLCPRQSGPRGAMYVFVAQRDQS